jgi:LysM repeat protein
MPKFKAGDTVSAIAKRNKISVQEFKKLNPQIEDIDDIFVNQEYNLSRPDKYTVRKGDTFSGIAPRVDISVDELMALNPSVDPRRMQINSVLNLLAQQQKPQAQPQQRPWPDFGGLSGFNARQQQEQMQRQSAPIEQDRAMASQGMGTPMLNAAMLGPAMGMRGMAMQGARGMANEANRYADAMRPPMQMPRNAGVRRDAGRYGQLEEPTISRGFMEEQFGRRPYNETADLTQRVAARRTNPQTLQERVQQKTEEIAGRANRYTDRKPGTLEEELEALRRLDDLRPWANKPQRTGQFAGDQNVPPVIRKREMDLSNRAYDPRIRDITLEDLVAQYGTNFGNPMGFR